MINGKKNDEIFKSQTIMLVTCLVVSVKEFIIYNFHVEWDDEHAISMSQMLLKYTNVLFHTTGEQLHMKTSLQKN